MAQPLPDPTAPSRRARARGLAFVAVFAAGLLAGWLARDLLPADPGAAVDPAGGIGATANGHGETRAETGSPDAFDPALAWSLALRSAELASLRSLLDELERDAADPRAAIDRAIAGTSDRELAGIVSAVTRLDEDALLASGDLRPFATRLVEVALDGFDGPSREAPAAETVRFATSTRDFDPDRSRETRFATDEDRIFAVIELPEYEAGLVMVKWRNAETRRIHSLQTLPHRAGEPLWSYLARDGDWDPGRYEVSFYTQDAEMRLLGRGEFDVEVEGEAEGE